MYGPQDFFAHFCQPLWNQASSGLRPDGAWNNYMWIKTWRFKRRRFTSWEWYLERNMTPKFVWNARKIAQWSKQKEDYKFVCSIDLKGFWNTFCESLTNWLLGSEYFQRFTYITFYSETFPGINCISFNKCVSWELLSTCTCLSFHLFKIQKCQKMAKSFKICG